MATMGYDHECVVHDGDPEKAEKALPMIHLVFFNLKGWLLGARHGASMQVVLNEANCLPLKSCRKNLHFTVRRICNVMYAIVNKENIFFGKILAVYGPEIVVRRQIV